jgi:DNA-binding CsgD family transcriptional regulator
VGEAARRADEWLDVVADLLATPLERWPEEAIAAQLRNTFEAPSCSYNDVAPGHPRVHRIWPLTESFGGHRVEIERWAAQRAHLEHPLLCFYQATVSRIPMQVADVPDTFAGPRVRGAWAEVGRLGGAHHQLALPLRLDRGGHRAFVLGRSDAFVREDMALARRIWRLLTGLDGQIRALEAAQGDCDLAWRVDARAASGLTPREEAVLKLLSQGLTAGAIGRQLRIVEATVHKHLEHLYAKLEVSDRLSAVLRAQQLGMLPTRSPRDAP